MTISFLSASCEFFFFCRLCERSSVRRLFCSRAQDGSFSRTKSGNRSELPSSGRNGKHLNCPHTILNMRARQQNKPLYRRWLSFGTLCDHPFDPAPVSFCFTSQIERNQPMPHDPSQHTVTFYWDYLSPFAYLAYFQLVELQQKLAQENRGKTFQFELIPVVFGKLLDEWGNLGPAEVPSKRRVG